MMKKRVWWFVRVALSVLILWLVFRRIDFAGVSHSFTRIDTYVIVLLVVTALLKHALEYANWYWYLHLDPDRRHRHAEALRAHLIGLALRFVAPGGHGVWGKMFFIDASKKQTAISIGVERFLITWTSILFAVVAGQFYFTSIALWIRLVTLAATMLLPVAAGEIWRRWKHQSALPLRYMRLLPRVILTRGLFYGVTSLQYWLVLNQLGEISLTQALLCTPIILFANVIPISYSGLGLREGFAVEVLAGLGFAPESAVTVSLSVFLFNTLLPSLPGAVLVAAHQNKAPEKG